jgi:hypothetical protein
MRQRLRINATAARSRSAGQWPANRFSDCFAAHGVVNAVEVILRQARHIRKPRQVDLIVEITG